MNTIVLLYERLLVAMALAAAIIVGALSLWITYEVGMRYFLRSPTSWAVDLSEYALLWVVFLAAPWVLREEEHIKMDIVVDRVPPRLRRWLGIATSLAGAAICATMTYYGILVEWDLYVRNLDFAHEWQVRQYAVYPIIPLGFLLLTIEFLRRAERFRRGIERRVVSMGEAGAKPAGL